HVCRDMSSLCDELSDGAGAILLAEEALSGATRLRLAAMLTRESPWSDLPVLIMTRQGANSGSVVGALSTLCNVTLLERPTRVSTLVSAVRTGLRARRRQYQTRSHLIERERAEKSLREA